MKVLFLGDVFGKPGRQAVAHRVPRLIARDGLDLVIANGENAAAGSGITPDLAEELLASEVNLLTSGNHIWSKREIVPYLDRPDARLLRPANYPPGTPGRGRGVATTPDGRSAAMPADARSTDHCANLLPFCEFPLLRCRVLIW